MIIQTLGSHVNLFLQKREKETKMITAIRNTAAAIRNAASNLIWSSTKGTTNRGTETPVQGTADIGTATRIVGYGAATQNTVDTGAATQGIVKHEDPTMATDKIGTATKGTTTKGTKKLEVATRSASPSSTNIRPDKHPPLVVVDAKSICHPVFRRRAGAVFLQLLSFTNHQTGLCWPSVETIANNSGIDERHVQEDLAWLQNALVNGKPIIWFTGLTFGRGVRQWQINQFFLSPRMDGSSQQGVTDLAKGGDGSSHRGVTDLAQRGDGSSHPEQIKGTDQKKNNNNAHMCTCACARVDPTVADGVVVFPPTAQTATATAADTTDVVVFVSSFVQASTNGSATATFGISNSVSGSGTPKPAPAPVAPQTQVKPPVASTGAATQRVAPGGDTASVQAVKPATRPICAITNSGAMPAAPRQPALSAAATVANIGTATVAKPPQSTPVQPWPADLPVNAGENIDRFLADLLDKDAQYPNDMVTVRAEILATFEAKLDEIGNPVGYAQRMILVAKRGAFCPTYAKKKAIEEDSKAFFARQRQKEAEEEARRDAESADREAKIAAIRAAAGEHELEELRQRFIAGMDSMNRSRIVLNESDFRFKILFDCFLLKQVQNG